MHKINLQII